MTTPADNHLLSILRTFDVPGPRYTSYPTAPVFSKTYGAQQFEEDLSVNNQESNNSPLSLYVHIPFCDTLCYFCGCTTIITPNHRHAVEYLEALKVEITHTASRMAATRPVVQMAWGGGTPSFLSPEEIRDLAAHFKNHFTFAEDAEMSVELDPRELTFDHLKAFVASGANRFSLGVQDFQDDVQKAVNRIQPEALTKQVFAWSRDLGVTSMNVDLIYGLPLQTVDSFKRTLEKVVELSPERIAVFNFAYVPWLKPHQKLLHIDQLPSPDEKLQLLQLTINTLQNAGYEYIGMDHFAKPTDELALEQKRKRLHRNFQGYSIKAGADLFGFGMSAISHFGNVYSQNAKELPAYYEAVRSGNFPTILGYRMTRDDEIRKFVIMRLMCDLELHKRDVERRFAIVFDNYFASALEKLQAFLPQELISMDDDRIVVRDAGRFVLRNIAMCFDAYLEKLRKEKPIFSRTV
ncbi:MAG TPA: oxygen-independent coproporphyrinogen III oxidase [Bacteroidota bacterium]|nr:oxygen-independent coproporphyrinogen III oxidase [Bacteroidota bacterium]